MVDGFDLEGLPALASWCGGQVCNDGRRGLILLVTAEGPTRLSHGDYVLRCFDGTVIYFRRPCFEARPIAPSALDPKELSDLTIRMTREAATWRERAEGNLEQLQQVRAELAASRTAAFHWETTATLTEQRLVEQTRQVSILAEQVRQLRAAAAARAAQRAPLPKRGDHVQDRSGRYLGVVLEVGAAGLKYRSPDGIASAIALHEVKISKAPKEQAGSR